MRQLSTGVAEIDVGPTLQRAYRFGKLRSTAVRRLRSGIDELCFRRCRRHVDRISRSVEHLLAHPLEPWALHCGWLGGPAACTRRARRLSPGSCATLAWSGPSSTSPSPMPKAVSPRRHHRLRRHRAHAGVRRVPSSAPRWSVRQTERRTRSHDAITVIPVARRPRRDRSPAAAPSSCSPAPSPCPARRPRLPSAPGLPCSDTNVKPGDLGHRHRLQAGSRVRRALRGLRGRGGDRGSRRRDRTIQSSFVLIRYAPGDSGGTVRDGLCVRTSGPMVVELAGRTNVRFAARVGPILWVRGPLLARLDVLEHRLAQHAPIGTLDPPRARAVARVADPLEYGSPSSREVHRSHVRRVDAIAREPSGKAKPEPFVRTT